MNLRPALLMLQRNHSARLSPDGRLVAFVRATGDGPQLWLRTGTDECAVAAHPGGTVADLRWTADSATLLYRHTRHGRETWGLAAIRVPALAPVPLPQHGVVAEYWTAEDDPSALLYACRVGNSRYTELFRVDLDDPAAGAVPLARNPGFHRWLVDGQLRPRGGIRLAADGSAAVVLGADVATARPVLSVDPDALASLAVTRFSRDGSRLFLVSSAGVPTRQLTALALDGTATTLFADPELDLEGYPVAPEGVWFDPHTGEPDLCSVMHQRLRYHFLAAPPPQAAAHLSDTTRGTRLVLDRSADDKTWLIAEVHDCGPMHQYRYHVAEDRVEPLMVNRPELVGARLPSLEDFRFAARDGLAIPGYALRPLSGDPPFPTVVLVHGGPAGRDTWRFHAEAQYLATLGYLSLHVNYRGSRGFGTGFRQAGNGEWGGLMQQDLYDAVAHGVAVGLVDPARVTFMGASYGGYAALLAACTRPDLVRCAIAISPPCDLVSFATAPPRYWQPLVASLVRQILRRPDGQLVDPATLTRRSPAHVLTATCAPLLVAHGARDPRVPVGDVDAFVGRAAELGTPVRYLRFDDEGHLVKSDRNRERLFAAIEGFLEEHDARRP